MSKVMRMSDAEHRTTVAGWFGAVIAAIVMLVLHAGGTESLFLGSMVMSATGIVIIEAIREKGDGVSDAARAFVVLGLVAFWVCSWHWAVALIGTVAGTTVLWSVFGMQNEGRRR